MSVASQLERSPTIQRTAEAIAYHDRTPFRHLYNLATDNRIERRDDGLYRCHTDDGTWLVPDPRDVLRFTVMNTPDRCVDKYGRYVDFGAVETVVDVGAYIGEFSRAMEARGKSVLAVEPDPRNWDCVDANTQSATVEACAVGDSDGRATLNCSTDPSESSLLAPDAGTAATVSVRTHRLTTLCDERGVGPDLVKVEGEGHEPEILRGALDLDAVFTIDVSAERDGKSPRRECRHLLQEAGYETRYDESEEVLVGRP